MKMLFDTSVIIAAPVEKLLTLNIDHFKKVWPEGLVLFPDRSFPDQKKNKTISVPSVTRAQRAVIIRNNLI